MYLFIGRKNIFLPFKVYRYVCAHHGTATQLRLILKMAIIYSVLSFDGVISSKNVPLRQGKYIIIIYFVKTRVYIV